MTLKDLRALLKVLRENGVTSYEHDGVKLSLLELAPSKESFNTMGSKALANVLDNPGISEEELLFYSSPEAGIPVKE